MPIISVKAFSAPCSWGHCACSEGEVPSTQRLQVPFSSVVTKQVNAASIWDSPGKNPEWVAISFSKAGK